MKNKYMILALLPFLFQDTLHCEDQIKDINTIILNLDTTISNLYEHSKQGPVEKMAAIKQINLIKTDLETYKNEQYPNYWPKWMCSTPEIVKNKIQPALNKVNNSLKELRKWTSQDYAITLSTLAASTGLGGVVGLGAAATGLTIREFTKP